MIDPDDKPTGERATALSRTLTVEQPCPFCGDESNLEAIEAEGLAPLAHIRCNTCGARGPVTGNQKRAERDWDIRSGLLPVLSCRPKREV